MDEYERCWTKLYRKDHPIKFAKETKERNYLIWMPDVFLDIAYLQRIKELQYLK